MGPFLEPTITIDVTIMVFTAAKGSEMTMVFTTMDVMWVVNGGSRNGR
jgi:hypothetical protein